MNMLKKVFVAILAITVIGAGAAAAIHAAGEESDTIGAISPIANQGEATNSNPQVNAQENMGVPWQAEGTIINIDDTGFTLATESGEELYVELGPADYWLTQDIDLEVGMQVSVTGSENDGMYHAYQTMLTSGETLQVRTEQGQPLWSGGAQNSRGQGNAAGDGLASPEPQVQVDEWITLTGTLIAFQRGNMTVSTPEGNLLTFQTGQPRFFAEQGVTFAVGDALTLVGFYNGDQFFAGDITQNETGARVMLRDPNGRPLWAGPGSGNGNGFAGSNH
jgi:hypothetical protein